jgi:CubicO group peptidase (beta-lactamase class C family)
MITIKEITDSRFHQLSQKMNEYISEKKLPGIMTLIYQDGKIIHCEKNGVSDIETSQTLNFDSIYRIASMTKPIVCVAALMLNEEGKFSLDDPLSKYLPKAKQLKVFKEEVDGKIITESMTREVTIFDLFTHTSGFIYPWNPTHPIDKLYSELSGENGENIEKMTLQAAIDKYFDIPLRFQPGTKWRYGISTDILGYLIEVISGQSLDDFLRERIFDKLGMHDTGFFVPAQKWSRLIPIHTKDAEGHLIKDEDLHSDLAKTKPIFLSGGGGLVSTLSDYLKFAILLLNKGTFNQKELLKQETVELMISDYMAPRKINYIGIDPDEFLEIHEAEATFFRNYSEDYGFGLGVQVKIRESSVPAGIHGWNGTFTTSYWVDPKNQLIEIMFSQFVPNFSYPIFNEFMDLTYKALNL